MSDISTNSSIEADEPDEPKLQQPIRANALRNTFHFWKFLVMGLAVFVYGGLFFLYDGFVRYPRINSEIATYNAQISQMEKDGKPIEEVAALKTKRDGLGKEHDNLSLMLQRGIGMVCTPLGAWMLWRHLRATSGKYLLENDVLTLPRHKPIPIDSVTAVRNAKWMTKGLAYFDFKRPDGSAGSFTLDALAYESKPSDAIHDEIVERFRRRHEDVQLKTSAEMRVKD